MCVHTLPNPLKAASGRAGRRRHLILLLGAAVENAAFKLPRRCPSRATLGIMVPCQARVAHTAVQGPIAVWDITIGYSCMCVFEDVGI